MNRQYEEKCRQASEIVKYSLLPVPGGPLPEATPTVRFGRMWLDLVGFIDPLISEGLVTPQLGVEKLSPRLNFSYITYSSMTSVNSGYKFG